MWNKNIQSNLLLFFLVLVVPSAVFSQTNSADCPSVQLNMPNGIVAIEQETTLVLQIVGDFKGTIEWKTSAGKIVKGQGEQIATFFADENDGGKKVTVSVLLKGLSTTCTTELSDDFFIEDYLECGPVASFGKIGKSKTQLLSFLTVLDSLSLDLTNNPNAEGIISIQFDSKTTRNQKLKHLDRIVRHLNFRRLDLTRVKFIVTNESKHELTEFWRAMPGARLPKHLRQGQQIKAEDYFKNRPSLFK